MNMNNFSNTGMAGMQFVHGFQHRNYLKADAFMQKLNRILPDRRIFSQPQIKEVVLNGYCL